MTKIKYVSLFSGIGGFEFALNELGGECVLASEIDKKANQSYAALFGEPTSGDVTKIETKDIPEHDLLVGGFPCQAFSVAGKRGGFNDTRGTLFFQIARIAKEKKPKAMILENVKGLLSHDKGTTLDVICKTIDEIGYTFDIHIVNSKYYHVPQNRERIFFVCIRKDLVVSEEWKEETFKGSSAIAKAKKRIAGYGLSTFNFDWKKHDKVEVKIMDIMEKEKVDERYYSREYMVNEILDKMQDKYEFKVGLHPINATKDDCSYTITRSTHALYDYRGAIKRCQAVIFSELIPFEEVTQADLDILEIPIQVEDMLKESQKDSYKTLTKFKGEELNKQAKGSIVYGLGLLRTRRLTPVETLRIQGFPEHTYQTLLDNELAITNIYKQSGNAVTVNVIRDVGAKVLSIIDGFVGVDEEKRPLNKVPTNDSALPIEEPENTIQYGLNI